jgi:glycosyltransferase involved in cell wall biosynthesis
MMEDSDKTIWKPREAVAGDSGPMVSVLLATYNRPRYFSEALASILQQSYSNLQVIAVNDGGEDVSDVVNSFSDSRVVFINRRENRGLSFTLNEALARAKGEYVCYLGDDDLYYRHHVGTLVDVLENQTDCAVAYSDLYKVCCKVLPDQSRLVLSKVVEVSRDFDRFLVLYFNNVLHVSLMHRRDLLEKTGPYNEQINVLIDWDMTRRLSFFSDFCHVYDITGEYYNPVGDCDRISVQQRKDKNEYVRNALAIRTTRPPKPWPKIEDMSIIYVVDKLDKNTGKSLGAIWRYTFYPYKLYLPLGQKDLNRLKIEIPNIVSVPVESKATVTERIDIALAECEGEFVAIVPSDFPVREMWVEDSLCALINDSAGHAGYVLEGSTDERWAVVLRKGDLQQARRGFGSLQIRESLEAAGIALKRIRSEQIPFQFDQLLEDARRCQENGNWTKAGEIFEHIADDYENELWMKSLAGRAYFMAGDYARSAGLSGWVNGQRPTVNTLLLEAKLRHQEGSFHLAIELLERAKQILEGKELVWT